MIDLHYWPTPNGKKVTILLEECGMEYRIVECNIGKGDQFHLYLADGVTLIDETTWPDEHTTPSWGRCPDESGAFGYTAAQIGLMTASTMPCPRPAHSAKMYSVW